MKTHQVHVSVVRTVRWLVALLFLAPVLLAAPPVVEASRNCDVDRVYTVGSVSRCDRTYDDLPDTVDVTVSRTGTHVGAYGYETPYSQGHQARQGIVVSSGYPVAPTVWVSTLALDRGERDSYEVVYQRGGAQTKTLDIDVRYVFLAGDYDQDGQYSLPNTWLYTHRTGWTFISTEGLLSAAQDQGVPPEDLPDQATVFDLLNTAIDETLGDKGPEV